MSLQSVFFIFMFLITSACQKGIVSLAESYKNDIEAPSQVLNLQITSIPSEYTKSPVLSFDAATDDLSGVGNYEIRVLLTSDSSVVSDWQLASSSNQVSGLNLQTGVSYYLELRAIDRSGKKGLAVASDNFLAASDLCVGTKITNAPFAAGSGTAADPYLICTATQLMQISTDENYLKSQYSLAADLDLSLVVFDGIGSSSSPFSGKFFGNDRNVYGLNIQRVSGSYAGLFNKLEQAYVYDLKIHSPVINAGASNLVGVLAGYCDAGQISGIEISSLNITGNSSVGAIAGSLYQCSVFDSSFNGTLTANSDYVGGVTGDAGESHIFSIHSSLSISAPNSDQVGGVLGNEWGGVYIGNASIQSSLIGKDNVGGVAGGQDDEIYIQNVQVKGSISGQSSVGGILGYTNDSIVSLISNSVEADIEGNQAVGGIIGELNYWARIQDSYYSGDISGTGVSQQNFGGLIGRQIDNSYVNNVYTNANITSSAKNVGGIVGYLNTSSNSIEDSFSLTNITGSDSVNTISRFVGASVSSIPLTSNSYFLYESPCSNIQGLPCHEDGSLNPILSADYFRNAANPVFTNWDFTNVWQIVAGSYPSLRALTTNTLSASHSCVANVLAMNVFSCTLSMTGSSSLKTVVIDKTNTCNWLFPAKSKLYGTPTFSEIGNCTARYYITDGLNKSELYELDIEVLPVLGISHSNFNKIINVGSTAISTTINKELSLTNYYASETLSGITITGLPGSNHSFLGGSYPGTGGSCGSTLNPGESCSLFVSFTPPAGSTYSRTITVQYTDSGGPKSYTVRLQGSGL